VEGAREYWNGSGGSSEYWNGSEVTAVELRVRYGLRAVSVEGALSTRIASQTSDRRNVYKLAVLHTHFKLRASVTMMQLQWHTCKQVNANTVHVCIFLLSKFISCLRPVKLHAFTWLSTYASNATSLLSNKSSYKLVCSVLKYSPEVCNVM
jgi:hypothetical protein